MTKLDPTHEMIDCPKCSQRVHRRTWDGWIETHNCEPLCRGCGHRRSDHRPVCAGEKEYPYICRQDCMRFVSPVACPYCDGSGWLPEQYVGTPYAGRWRCVCWEHFNYGDAESKQRSRAIVALLETGQMTFGL